MSELIKLFVDEQTEEGKAIVQKLRDAGVQFSIIPAGGLPRLFVGHTRYVAAKYSGNEEIGNFLEKKKFSRETRKEKKVIYRIEKFTPHECPECRAAFNTEGKDYAVSLGHIVNGVKTKNERHEYDILRCTWCNNKTARVMIEAHELTSRTAAETKIRDEGFVNLVECEVSEVPHSIHIEYRRGAILTQIELTEEERESLTLPDGVFDKLCS